MSCSAVSLSIATIVSVIAVACLAIAFSTDNWYEIRINRNLTKAKLKEFNQEKELNEDFEKDLRYFSRDEGLFRICFVNKKPKDRKLISILIVLLIFLLLLFLFHIKNTSR